MKRDFSTIALIRGRDTAADWGGMNVQEEDDDEVEEEAGRQAFQGIILEGCEAKQTTVRGAVHPLVTPSVQAQRTLPEEKICLFL